MRILRAQSLIAAALAVVSGLQAQSPQPGVATIRARGDLVVVDVVVADAKHNAIHNLKPSDFTLLENNVPQQIRNFEEHKAPTAAEIAKRPPLPKLLPGYFTNYSPAPAGGTVNVLLLDALNTPLNAQVYVREQLLAYLKSAPPGAPLAIFGLSDHLILLQSFTSDPAILKAAVAQASTQLPSLLEDPATGKTSDSITDLMGSTTHGDSASSQIVANVLQFEKTLAAHHLELRAQQTLAAMNLLARYLESIPGRKNLIWFSGSFPLNVMPDGDLQDPFSIVANAEDEYRETTNLLTRSQVAVYPIDARGIITSAVHAASNPTKSYAMNPKSFAKDQSNFFQNLFAENDTMQQMAKDTGGRAFVDTDGLTAALAQAIDAGANYYTLSYTPSDHNWNGKYRKIAIKLQESTPHGTTHGTTLAYRRGYFADDPEATAKSHHEAAVATADRPDAMSVAMLRGSPEPSEILLKVRVLPSGIPPEETVAPGNALTADPAHKVTGPFRRFFVDLEADPGALSFALDPNGAYQCSAEFVTFVYDSEGFMIDAIDTPIKTKLTPARYATVLRTGLPFHQEVSVPVGAKTQRDFFLRIAVRDRLTGRIGAVEVPIISVERLNPLAR